MTQKEKEKEKKRKQIGDWFHSHLDSLGLYGYALYVLFKDDEEFEAVGEGKGAAVSVLYPYKIIYLSITQENYKNEENFKQLLFHEAVHVLLWDYTELAEKRYISREQLADAEEHLVDHITNVLFPVLNK